MEIQRTVRHGLALTCALAALWPAAGAHALTLEEALALARERAPESATARARIAESEGALRGAEVLLEENPALRAQGGPRYVRDGTWIVQADVELTQTFELSGARDARIESARASVEGARARADEGARDAMIRAARAFVAVLAADTAAELAEQELALVEELVAIAERRASAGDLAPLEVDRLRMSALGQRAELAAIAAERARWLSALRVAIGARAGEAIAPEGDLVAIARAQTSIGGEARGAMQAARAAVREADADARVGWAAEIPDLITGIGYSFEEGDHMALVTLGITLPLFERGQGAVATAQARRAVVELELAAVVSRLEVEAEAATAALEASLRALEHAVSAAEIATRTAQRVRRAWELGEVGVTEVLAIHREVLEVERARVVRSREAALSRIERDAASGGRDAVASGGAT